MRSNMELSQCITLDDLILALLVPIMNLDICNTETCDFV